MIEEGVTKTAKRSKAQPKRRGSEPETVVYIGPNKLADGLKKFTVYRGQPVELITQITAKYQNAGRLFVPVDTLGQAMADAQKKGTPVYLAYMEVQEGASN